MLQLQTRYSRSFEHVKGRQLMWFIDRSFQESSPFYHYNTTQALFKLQMMNDDLRTFLNHWDYLMSQIENHPPEDQTRLAFWLQVSQHSNKQWQQKIAYIRTEPADDPSRSLENLRHLCYVHYAQVDREAQERKLLKTGSLNHHMQQMKDSNKSMFAITDKDKPQKQRQQGICKYWRIHGR